MTARVEVLKPEFVEFMPDELQLGVLYISMKFKSVQHLCCCGCGRKVVTPLSPTGWRMTFDGREVSIRPSIGSWQKECRSHYFITANRIHWAPQWSDEEIAFGLENDVQEKLDYYERDRSEVAEEVEAEVQPQRRQSLIARIVDFIKKLARR